MFVPDYPHCLIPEEGWNRCIKCGTILSVCCDAMVGRRIEGSRHDCIDDSLGDDAMSLKNRAFPSGEIPNLSTSLLGTLHGAEHFKFRQKGKGKEDWNGKTVSMDLFQPDVDYAIIDGEMIVVAWYIQYLHERSIPYRKEFHGKREYDTMKDKVLKANPDLQIYFEEYENLARNEAGNPWAEFKGKVSVNHCPTNLNYWHFTIDLYSADAPEAAIKNYKGAWRIMMCDNLADYLRRSFYILSDEFQPPTISKWEDFVKRG